MQYSQFAELDIVINLLGTCDDKRSTYFNNMIRTNAEEMVEFKLRAMNII